MYAQKLAQLAKLARTVAIGTSGATILLIAIAFATERHVGYQLDRFVAGKEESPVLAVYLLILAIVLVGYLAAVRKKSARSGGLLALGGIAALYAWCQFGFDMTLSPIMLVIAGPALFHLLGVKMQQASLRQQVAAKSLETPTDSATEQQVAPEPTGELVAGAA